MPEKSAAQQIIEALAAAIRGKADTAIVAVAGYCFSGSSNLNTVMATAGENAGFGDVVDAYIDARTADACNICNMIKSVGF